MVLNHCFLVTCSSSNLHMCDSTPAFATNFNPMISRVSRSWSEDNKGQPMTAASYGNTKPTPTVKPLATPPRQPEVKTLLPASNVANLSTAGNETHPPMSPANSSRRHPQAEEGGAISVPTSGLLSSPPGCISSVTEHNVTLRGGLHAGKFTDAGKVDGSYTCTELCCEADSCDVAFFAFHRCFLVKCFDEYLCTSTPSLLPNFNPTLVHVYRHHSKPTPRPTTTLPPINYVLQQIEDETKTKSKSKNKTCPHSDVYEEVTLRKGYKAGKFTSRGKVNSTDECVDFCCRQPGCDLIFMFLNNCFTVSCSSGVACEIVSARQSRFKPRVVYLIKNNSTKLIKPSQLNSSLSDPKSFVGEQPVNAVHYKELRSDKYNRDSYKKDFSQMSNVTETIDEEFTEIPDNKITSRTIINSAANTTSQFLKNNVSEHVVGKQTVDTLHNKVLRSSKKNQGSPKKNFTQMSSDTDTVNEEFTEITSRTVINSAGNASSQRQKHNVGNHLIVKSDIHATKQHLKDKQKPKLKSSKMTNHKESRTDEKMDQVLSKLTNVTEENKRLEGEVHVLMAKQSKRSHRSRITSSVSARGERRKEKSKSSKNIKRKRIKYKAKRRLGRLRFSGNGSGMDSSARKRVVIVDTDRPPVFPPTDEHKIEEHRIHAFQRKTYQKDHNLKSEKATTMERPLKKQHNNKKKKLKHWDPTNEHDIEEHAIYRSTDETGSGTESKKILKVEEGSEVKYGHPEDDLDTNDLELNEIVKLKPNNKHARKPDKPVWIGSTDENKGDRESFQQITPTHKSHFQFNDQTNKKHTGEDEFHIEHQGQPMLADKDVWMNSRNGNIDHKESFHEQIVPTHKSHFQFNDQTNKKHTREDEFHIEHQGQPMLADKDVWMNSRNGKIDHKETFHKQIVPTHKSHFQFDSQKGLGHTSDEEFHIKKQDNPTSPAKHAWMSSKNKNVDRLENFDEQIAPTHKSHFLLDRGKARMGEDEFNIDGNDKSEESERHFLVSSRDRNEDHLGSFHEQIDPTHKSSFEFEKQRINKYIREDYIHKGRQDEPDVSEDHVWTSAGNRNEDRLKSFHDQIAPTHRSLFQLNGENQNTKEDEFDFETHRGPEDPERHKWISLRNKSEDRQGSSREQAASTHTAHFQLEKSEDNYDSKEDDIHIGDYVEPQDSQKHGWESSRNQSRGHMETENFHKLHIVQQHKPSLHEVAHGKAEDQHDNERQEMLAQNTSKKPETSRTGHSVEGPVFETDDFAKRHKQVPHDHNKDSYAKSSEKMALTEKSLNISTSSSVTEHSRNGHETLTHPDRNKTNNSHEKPDFDAIYNKINNIYNRLQDLFDEQAQRERNATMSSRETQGRLDGVIENAKRRQEGIPTPPVSSLRPTTRPSRITPPTKRVRVVKQFVTDDFGGSSVPSYRHRDALMDYIKTIYNRVQELYKRKLENPRLRVSTDHKRSKFHHVLASGDDRKQMKTSMARGRSKKAKKYHRKKVEEEAVLKEMKRIYKNMKKMYHQERKAQKKAEIIAKTSEKQHQRSYIPSSYGTREGHSRTSLPVGSAKPTGLVTSLNRPIPLTNSITGARVKPQARKTHNQRVTHETTKQPSVKSYQRGREHKPTESSKGSNDSIRHGGILADSLASRRPTVNQSFIDRIVAEIQAEHPVIGKKKASNKSDNLQQLIDNVADSVVKQVTDEFIGERHQPSRRVDVPKPPLQTVASAPEDVRPSMPLLNDQPDQKTHVKAAAFLESAIKKLASKDEELPPEMINSDEITGVPSVPLAEDVKPPSMTSPATVSHVSSDYAAREKDPQRRPQPEIPGKQEIREMFKFKHRLKKKKPMIEKGSKKLTIPATTEGNREYLVLHMGFEDIENRTALDSSGHNNNAVLSAEVRLSVTESKCGSALSMGGGRLRFTHFNSRPREAITIALWLKLDSVSGRTTLFKTTGSGAKYHLKVADGIIYWSHVDDLGHVIFSMETRQSVDSLDWVHVSATYDSHINMSKIIVNGAVLDEKEGFGLLSQNWDGEVGIGITEGIRGLIDEFYMYNHALAASDLSDLSEECNPGAGGAIPLKEGSYDGLIPGEMIEDATLVLHPNATTTKKPTAAPTTKTTQSTTPSTRSSTKLVPPTSPTTAPTTSVTTTTAKPTNLSTKPVVTSKTTTPYKPTLQVPAAATLSRNGGVSSVPSTITLHDEPNCEQGMFYFNSQLRGGMDAGLFIDLGRVKGTTSCLKFCCEIESCDLVFMKRDSCYAVDCFNSHLCEPVAAVPYRSDMPSVYYVTRNGKSILDEKLKKLETRPTTRPTTNQRSTQPPPTIITPSEMFLPYLKISTPPTHSSPVTKRFCAQGMFFYDVKLRDGWNAGMLLQATRVNSMTECIQLCCDEPACDFVMLKNRKCYTVRCKGGDTCTVEEGGNYQISFVSRQDMVEDETISTPTPTPLPLSPLGGNIDDLPGNHLRYLSLYLGFDHVIGSVAVDGSGLNNDARLTKGTEVTRLDKGGFDIKLNGGDVLLDGEHFREKPREAVSIALWVKLWRTGGVHSMFDTIGGHSIHRKGQYHFEVYNGRLRWFHRNEYAKEVFSVRTSPLLQPNLWYHVVGTYDSRTHMARVFLNGDLVGEGHGSGMLSLDWEAKAGFGSHSGRRILLGYLDEIYIFRRALLEKEIDRYLESPNRDSLLQPDSDGIYTDSYTEDPSEDDSFSDINTDTVWFSRPTNRLTNYPLPRLSNITTTYAEQGQKPTAAVSAERAEPTPRQTTQTTTVKSLQTTEKTTQSTTPPTTLKATTTMKTTPTPAKFPSTAKESFDSVCRLGNVYRNRDLIGGLGAGNFTDKGIVNTIEECMKICCGVPDCSVAYMVENNCFVITCKEKEQCNTFMKNPSEKSPVIGFVDRNRLEESTPRPSTAEETNELPSLSKSDVRVGSDTDSKAFYTSEDDTEPANNLIDILSTKKPTLSVTSEPAMSRCTHSRLYRHVTLIGGLRAGNFTRMADHVDMDECSRKCCAQRSCNLAILMRDTCFGLHCSRPELCSTRPARLIGFSLKIMYIYREDSKAQAKATAKTTEPSLEELLGEVKPTQSPTTAPSLNTMLGFPRMDTNHVVTPKPPNECSQGLTVNNVILNGGIGAGEVTQFSDVSDLQLCIEKCCESSKCHLAYVIHDACYTVNCFSRDLCRTRPIENTAVHSVISYVKRTGTSMFSTAEQASVENLRNAAIQPTTNDISAADITKDSRNNTICQKDRTFYNVQLKGGQSTGVFTERGLVSDISQCAGICCGDQSCDLAYAEGQRCYTVKCYNQESCQFIEASPLAVKTAMAYVIRLTNKNVIQVPPRPTESATGRLETSKLVMSTTIKPIVHGDHSKHEETSNDAKERDSHQKKAEGHDGLRPYHLLKQKLHKHHHHHHSNGFKCPARRYGCQHYCVHLPDGGHRCMCHHGYSLAPNGRHCEDVDECTDDTHGCEHDCINNDGSYQCECRSGFMLSKDRRHCDDLDECTMEVHSCSHLCHNTPGSYTCSCKDGYQLQADKRHCIVVTEVGSKKDQEHPSVAGLEIPTTITQGPTDVSVTQGESGIFHCKARGHPAPHIAWAAGPNGDRPIPSEERFRILPGGSLVIGHVNFTDQGLYRCVASNPAGSATAAATLSVTDLDECSARSNDCQQVCVNTEGSFRCECNSGFMLNRDRKSCQDVDECTVGSHFCDDICHNTLGSFTCHCRSGYRLMADLRTCLDIDECTEPGHGCSQLCNNTMGGYNCYCLKGYWLLKDNKTCIDHHIMLDSSKPTTLSAGMGAFVAIASVSVLIVISTVICVIRYRRRARLKGNDMVEGERKSLFSWME